MRGDEHKAIRKAAKLNQEEWGELIGVGRIAISDWERGANQIPPMAEIVARLIDDEPEMLFRIQRIRGLRK